MGVEETWRALAEGRDGIRAIRRFSVAPFDVSIGAMVPGFDDRPDDADGAIAIDLAIVAAREALLAAALPASLGRERIGLVLGSSLARRGVHLDAITAAIARAIAVDGPRLTVSTACASSTNAIGLAKDLLDRGVVDAVVAGGVDTLTMDIFAGFHVLGLLSRDKCTPWSGEPGTTLGEGAGFVVLELADRAASRGAASWGTLLGYALSSDAHHVTSPDPSGGGVARALRWALADADLDAAEVDYVNAHGTGTLANDAAEWRAIEVTFGARAKAIPVSSTKSYLGHAQGAAGVLELVATLLAMKHGAVLPTLRCDAPRPRAPVDPVRGDRPRSGSVRCAVSTNSAFGGANAAVVVARPTFTRRAPRPSARPPRDVYWIGGGVIGGFSPDIATGRARDLLDAARPTRGRARALDVGRFVATADPRGLDRSAQLLVTAVAAAIDESGWTLRGDARDRTGIFVASARVSPESAAEFDASVDARGWAKASAGAFSRLVVNAPTGACAKLLSIRGPTTTLVGGRGGSLLAIAQAAEWLARRRDADVIVAAGIDEVEQARGAHDLEASVALVLGVEATGRQSGVIVRVEGTGIAAPMRGEAALEGAGRAAGLTTAEARAIPVVRAPELDAAFVCAPGLELILARDAILRGDLRGAAVVSETESASVAVLLGRASADG